MIGRIGFILFAFTLYAISKYFGAEKQCELIENYVDVILTIAYFGGIA
jgi:hypothetical protein